LDMTEAGVTNYEGTVVIQQTGVRHNVSNGIDVASAGTTPTLPSA
jgi:hypothetical protein